MQARNKSQNMRLKNRSTLDYFVLSARVPGERLADGQPTSGLDTLMPRLGGPTGPGVRTSKAALHDAACEGDVTAMFEYALTCADATGREYWLHQAASEGNVNALYYLAQESNDADERRQYLTLAAEYGYVPAMHWLGLSCTNPHERRRWLDQAARKGWETSMAELADMCVD